MRSSEETSDADIEYAMAVRQVTNESIDRRYPNDKKNRPVR